MLIHSHQDNWTDDFNKIKEIIIEALGNVEITIEHIGSTAVKSLAAKPIIDLDIVYDKNVLFEEIKIGLEKIGYHHNGDQGINGREAFKRIDLKEKHIILDFIKHHLYVCRVDSEELQRHLTFRNYLIENEKERKEYEKLKYEIAEIANQDRKVYAELKEVMAKEFVESILRKAKEERE